MAKSSVSLKDNSGLTRVTNVEPCQKCLLDGKFNMKNNHVNTTNNADNVLRSSSMPNNASINSKLPDSALVDHVNRVMDPTTTSSCEHHKAASDDRTCVASRVRPLQEGFKKRRLVRTSDIFRLSPKIARSGNVVRCRCLPHTYCVLCGGRYGLLQPNDANPSSSLEQKVSTVDPSFHPVLSFKQDISIPVRFEKLLKGGEWQKVNSKSQPLIKKKSNLTLNNHARSHSKKLAKSAAAQLLSTAKLRKNFGGDKKLARTSLPPKNGANLRKKRAAKMALAIKKHHLLDRGQFATSSTNSSKAGSPVPSPAPADALPGKGQGNALQGNNALVEAARKRRDSAYDIDNIVIPYCMTAATRIEKLQYKEIITPKWRLLEEYETTPVISKEDICKNNGIIKPSDNQPDVNEVEDLTDESYATRHAVCEISEKKRFLTAFTQLPGRTRSRVARIDSRADSSGANTPDPMSPHNVEHLISDHLSPVTSPLMPAAHAEDSMPPTPTSLLQNITAVRLQERRRTTSASGKEIGGSRAGYESGATTPEIEGPPVIPFEPRTFPLSDDEYRELLEVSSQPNKPTMISPHMLKSTGSSGGGGNITLEATGEPAAICPQTPEFPSSASGSIVDEQEDPNDPEWTVISNEKPVQQRHSSIVLKLTKR